MAAMYVKLPPSVHRIVRDVARSELRKEQDQVVVFVREALQARGKLSNETIGEKQLAPTGEAA